MLGPWFAEKSTSHFWYITDAPAPFSRVIGQTWSFNTPGDDVEPRARLMAAAPELLAALKLAKSICQDAFKDTAMDWDDQSMSLINAAIAKAEGHHD